MGTITKYYPFIDEETQSILNSLMDESSSYFDFVQRLANEVLEKEVPVNLAYLAAVQAWWAREVEIMSQIQARYNDVSCIRPWGYPHGEASSDQLRYHDAVVEAIKEAMDISLDDWMVTELHLLHTFFHWPIHGDIPSYLEPLEKARSLVDTNPQLNCFESLICAFDGWAKYREGQPKDSLALAQRGQELAEVHDDTLYKYMNLGVEAVVHFNFNIPESLARYEELYDMVQVLEVPYLIAEVLNDSSLAFEAAGEYDLAISSHLEGIKILGEGDTPYVVLSRIYCTLGDGLQALEFVKEASEYAGHLNNQVLFLRKAWALALLNRLEEAEQYLELVHPMVMESGSEGRLGHYYRISGVIELVRGNYLDAIDLLEKVMEISERGPNIISMNNALIDLTRAELLLANQSADSLESIRPGKWLSRLEKHAIEHDLPGIRMYAALFKSEFYQNHDQLKDAQATLLDALNITESLGVKTLRKKITDRIREMNQLLREAEVSAKKMKK
jgi:tetratricopeptide (TPR) repeat protein